MRKALISLVGVALVALAIVGCGDSSDAEDATSTVTLSKAEFVSQANQICKSSRADLTKRFTAYMEDHFEEGEGVKGRAELTTGAVNNVLVPELESRIAEIRELGQPREGEAEVGAYLATLQTAINTVKEEDASSLSDIEKVLSSAGEAGGEYGLVEC